MSTTYDHLFRLLLVGDSGVGKTCIMFRFVDNTFNPCFVSTIGIDFKITRLEVDGKNIKLQIWDTAGQERFYTITTACYRRAMGIMLVYDVTNEASFGNIKYWLSLIKDNADSGVARILVANKCDLEEKRQVSKERGERLAKDLGVRYVEISALSSSNIGEAFNILVQDIWKKKVLQESVEAVNKGWSSFGAKQEKSNFNCNCA